MGSQFPDFYQVPVSPWSAPPGSVADEFKLLNTTGRPAAIYQANVVRVDVVAGAYNTVQVTWPAVAGYTGSYDVYSGFSLYLSHAQLKLSTPGTTGTFQYFPSVPTDLVPQVWVRAGAMLLQADPANVEANKDYFGRDTNPLDPTNHSNDMYNSQDNSAVVGDNDYMRFVAAEIRRRAILMLANDGEEFVLYVRRWSGRRCNCNQVAANLVTGQDAIQGQIPLDDPYVKDPAASMQEEAQDPQGDALARCPRCLGTGILGAYYPGITTLMRYGNLPPRAIVYKNFAIDIPYNFNTWTVWEPKLHSHDIVRRIKTGEMFEVQDAARGEWRGVPFHQEAKLNLLPPGDHRYTVTDAQISAADGI